MSSDSVYGIICSGLTAKTKLSFTSFNSSFTECVRKHTPLPLSLYDLSSNNSDSSCRDSCLFTLNPLTLSSSATFASCVWRNCKADYGGGIYLNVSNSGVSLTVTKSEFHSCEADPYRGGGIYVEGIGSLQVRDSLFHKCSAGGFDDYGGGGIEVNTCGEYPLIEDTSFISCQSGSDGAGMGIWSPPFYHKTCLLNSRFVSCRAAPFGNDNDGASLMVWNSSALICISNSIFAHSHSEYRGGAVTQYIFNNASHSSSIHLFLFCFFKDNSAEFKPGNDVYFHDWIPSNPFLHCFSTTQEYRISYYSSRDYHFDKDNWLPYTIIYIYST